MFLKSLEINGFKSFPDRTHIDFSDGITSLLGPNGCGKSNIVDSIKWVLGEQSTKTLRAGKMEDVIFYVTDTRKHINIAEVTITIDYENRNLPTDIPEVVIRRRIYRDGGSEYYINGTKCLLKNIRELFMDTGVGKSAYSILEQGKIDQILSNKPEDRRYIFEEAAGISRYKAKCNEAQQRILHSEEHIASLLVTVNEVKRTYDRTKGQAMKAREWKELKDRAFELDVNMRLVRLDTLLKLKDDRIRRRDEAKVTEENLSKQLGSFDEDISSSSEELNQFREEFRKIEIEISKNETSIVGIDKEIAIYEENYRAYLETLKDGEAKCKSIRDEIERYKEERAETEEAIGEKEDYLEDKEKSLRNAELLLSETRDDISSLNKTISNAEERNSEIDVDLMNLSLELKNVIESLIREVDEKSSSDYTDERLKGAEKKLRAMLYTIKTKLDKSENLSVIKSDVDKAEELFDEYIDSIPPIVDLILSPEGLINKKRVIEEKENKLRSESDKNKEAIKNAKSERDKKEEDVQILQTTITSMKENISALKAVIEGYKDNLARFSRTISERELDLDDEETKAEIARSKVKDINEKLRDKDSEKNELEANLKDLKEEHGKLYEELALQNERLSNKRREKERIQEEIRSAQNTFQSENMYLENTDNMIKELLTSFFEQYARNLLEFQDRIKEGLPDEMLIKNELDEVNKSIQRLGNINHLASDEFEQAEEQYRFYSRQLEDYNKAKSDMESVLKEIQDKSSELFLKSYKEISDNFQAMFKRLFGGGRAELRLVDPDDVLNTGIEILAQPPGKSMATLSLLSGGERSMTAVALLFATYQVKPSPFCILDEIDAALDDRNIGFFLDVLKEFGESSQFIIITHNKHTVTGGNAMLGVSQQEAGVSTAVAYRIGNVKGEAVIMNESEEEVDFDDEGRIKK